MTKWQIYVVYLNGKDATYEVNSWEVGYGCLNFGLRDGSWIWTPLWNIKEFAIKDMGDGI